MLFERQLKIQSSVKTLLKAYLFSNDQKRNRGARKMNLFTILHWWNFDIKIHATSVVKKIHFPSTSMVVAKKKQLYHRSKQTAHLSNIAYLGKD